MLWVSSDGEFGLFQEDQQGRQASHPVVREKLAEIVEKTMEGLKNEHGIAEMMGR